MADAGPAPRLPAQLAGLFADGGPGRTLSVALPAGQLVGPAGQPLRPDPQWFDDHGYTAVRRPAFWQSDAPATATLWTRLRAEHDRSGLWPLLLEDLGVGAGPTQPWLIGSVASAEPVSEIEIYDVAGFLAAEWAGFVAANQEELQEEPEFLLPFGRDWPGLAAPGALTDDPAVVADRCAEQAAHSDMRLGLVPVSRGADALVATGWLGAANHFERTSQLAAVVRSWEGRFGARVVGLGCDTACLSVAAPPRSFTHALHVAAEHLLVCLDNIDGVGILAEYAEQLRGKTTWSFWWD